MIERLDRDREEEKKCYDHNYGKKKPSYRKGFDAGLRDGQKREVEQRTKNPYFIPSELRVLLKKRARWQMGYDAGWQIGGKKKKLKKKRQHESE